MVRRSQIWWAELPEPQASEPGYRRPVLIVQADEFNISRLNTVLVVALTGNLRLAAAPGNLRLAKSKTGLPKDSVANVSQVLTLDKDFLTELTGQLDTRTMQQIDEGLRLALDL
jgi:mRNA interferase MazF